MKFEYDPAKSAANLDKHGIDFEDVQELWDGPVVNVPLASKGERRVKAIGRICGEYWAVIYTTRGDATRIISARRAEPGERSAYDRYA